MTISRITIGRCPGELAPLQGRCQTASPPAVFDHGQAVLGTFRVTVPRQEARIPDDDPVLERHDRSARERRLLAQPRLDRHRGGPGPQGHVRVSLAGKGIGALEKLGPVRHGRERETDERRVGRTGRLVGRQAADLFDLAIDLLEAVPRREGECAVILGMAPDRGETARRCVIHQVAQDRGSRAPSPVIGEDPRSDVRAGRLRPIDEAAADDLTCRFDQDEEAVRAGFCLEELDRWRRVVGLDHAPDPRPFHEIGLGLGRTDRIRAIGDHGQNGTTSGSDGASRHLGGARQRSRYDRGDDRTRGADRRSGSDGADAGGRAGPGGRRRGHRRTARQPGPRRFAGGRSARAHHRGARSARDRRPVPVGGTGGPGRRVRLDPPGHQRLSHAAQLRARTAAEPDRAHPRRLGGRACGAHLSRT